MLVSHWSYIKMSMLTNTLFEKVNWYMVPIVDTKMKKGSGSMVANDFLMIVTTWYPGHGLHSII